ncbi:nuclear transport factor 2 family protein [Planktotalea sp.]|uniref:nuclear transport factor 2 family protein n=1 Tax=Planktotalea sp. TaxID=2029877 RepID=UPI0025D1D3C8|nr:nuclear transport factor 2 family protein [Planktotalea sp.]
MSECISTFFDAWGMRDDSPRLDTIAAAFASEGNYADPRSPEPLTGAAAIAGYVNNFSAGALGWTASVVNLSSTGTSHRVTVAFGGMGPDGKEMVQHGQYFTDVDGDKITRMVGFVGTGAPE